MTDTGKETPAEVRLLLRLLDDAYDRPAWHGPNLRGSLRRVKCEQAAWKPAPDHPGIWELALHAAYWKYAVRRRLTGTKRGSFPREGADWFTGPSGAASAALARKWREDVALLEEMHGQLRAVVAALGGPDLERVLYGRMTVGELVSGVAAHDLYHAGQIQTLKHLFRQASAQQADG